VNIHIFALFYLVTDTPPPRESLLHFTARLGLAKVTTFLLRKPGSKQCLKLHNKNGQLPKDVAIENGYDGLAELLSEYVFLYFLGII
jgi:hypothetical protein